MSIYIPGYTAGDQAVALQLIADHPFATLVTSVDGEAPHVTYVPLLHEDGVLLGHVATANPHWRKFARGRTVALFHGPHAFVSPYWYEQPAQNVPTWNYAAVHAHGTPQLDDTHNRAHAERLFARFGGGQPLPTDPATVTRLLGGIVSFRMPIERFDVKVKMSQNKSAGDRAGVIRGLRATGRAEDAATADWMQAHEPG